ASPEAGEKQAVCPLARGLLLRELAREVVDLRAAVPSRGSRPRARGTNDCGAMKKGACALRAGWCRTPEARVQSHGHEAERNLRRDRWLRPILVALAARVWRFCRSDRIATIAVRGGRIRRSRRVTLGHAALVKRYAFEFCTALLVLALGGCRNEPDKPQREPPPPPAATTKAGSCSTGSAKIADPET